MRLLDIGQGLYINPEYIVKMEKSKVLVGDNILFTVDIHLAYNININNSFNSRNNIEKLSFDSAQKRDDYFVYLFRVINGENLS